MGNDVTEVPLSERALAKFIAVSDRLSQYESKLNTQGGTSLSSYMYVLGAFGSSEIFVGESRKGK